MKKIGLYSVMLVFGLGLTANSCRKPVDPCAKVKCYNDGKCIDGKCKCPEGWTGPDCREPKRKP